MEDEIVKLLSKEIDKKLVDDLIESYIKIKKEFINSNYEETQSKSGKFVENVFRVLHYIRTKQIKSEIKQHEINDEINKLLNLDGKKFSESIRILIPEIANTVIYLLRSKLGSVHVKPIKPDFIDAKLTVDACNWIIAELLRTYHERNTDSVENLIKNVVQEDIPILQKYGDEIFLNVKVKAEDEILIRLLDANDGLTRKELGTHMKANFSKSTITSTVKKLSKERKIHLSKNKKLILADSERKNVSQLIQKLTKEI